MEESQEVKEDLAGEGRGGIPKPSKIPGLRIIPQTTLGILLSFKVSSSIEGYWKVWVQHW